MLPKWFSIILPILWSGHPGDRATNLELVEQKTYIYADCDLFIYFDYSQIMKMKAVRDQKRRFKQHAVSPSSRLHSQNHCNM